MNFRPRPSPLLVVRVISHSHWGCCYCRLGWCYSSKGLKAGVNSYALQSICKSYPYNRLESFLWPCTITRMRTCCSRGKKTWRKTSLFHNFCDPLWLLVTLPPLLSAPSSALFSHLAPMLVRALNHQITPALYLSLKQDRAFLFLWHIKPEWYLFMAIMVSRCSCNHSIRKTTLQFILKFFWSGYSKSSISDWVWTGLCGKVQERNNSEYLQL